MGILAVSHRLCTLGVITAILAAQLISAHFRLLAPPTVGLDDDEQGSFPCGGYMPNLTASDEISISDFHIDGEHIAVYLGHSSANWLFRGVALTSDTPYNASDYASSNSSAWDPSNFEQLYPIIKQMDPEYLCMPSVKAPGDWVGEKGIISVISNGPDGLMYQCAAVNFVSGSAAPASDVCNNGTYNHYTEAIFANDSTLEALVASPLPVPPNPTTSTAAAPSATRDLSGDRWGSTSHPGLSHSARIAVATVMSIFGIFVVCALVVLCRKRMMELKAGETRPHGRRDDGLSRPLAMRQLSRRTDVTEDGVADPPPPYEYNVTPPVTAQAGTATGANAPPGSIAPPAYTGSSQRPISTASPL